MDREGALRGSAISVVGLAIYLAVVVGTTPSLPPLTAIRLTLAINAPFLAAFLGSLWAQGYLQAKLAAKRCRIKSKATTSVSASGSFISAFVSFLPLTHVGCCGLWLYLLSIIAGTGGAGLAFVSTVLNAPLQLMALGIATIWATNAYLYLRYRRVPSLGSPAEEIDQGSDG